MKKADIEKTNKSIIDSLINDYQATDIQEEKGWRWSCKIQTIYGGYNVSIYEPDGRNQIASILGRFDNPELAKEDTGCNPYSGKFNFHRQTVNELQVDFMRFVSYAYEPLQLEATA